MTPLNSTLLHLILVPQGNGVCLELRSEPVLVSLGVAGGLSLLQLQLPEKGRNWPIGVGLTRWAAGAVFVQPLLFRHL